MKILLIFFTFYLISGAVKDIDVTGYSGESILINAGRVVPNLCCKVSQRVMVNIGENSTFSCEYSQNHINDPKIIFKEGKDSIDEVIHSTWKKNERDELILPPVVRHEGESAEIICPYDSIYKSKPKSLCKGKCSTRDRNTLNETVREEKETKTDRLTLNDDVTASVFTGTITGLTAEDAGKYWCAVTLERDLNYLDTHLIVIMNEELNLTKYEGDDVSIQCKHQDEDQKSFCKAHEASMCVKDGVSLKTIRDDRFSFSDEASTGVFTVNIIDLREEDSGIYWCGAHVIRIVHLYVKKDFSMIIIISVCVILLLIGGFTLTVWKLRHRRGGGTYTHPSSVYCTVTHNPL
ncbi:polymeric immunoglobulin receptor-like protein [Labeo rohita]|nr:polymeric immunoglobulin receptor-like protein [Labeo rohita]RXN34763.1 polymeric immunoglobulin receptor-like protein [Labeo rohita]